MASIEEEQFFRKSVTEAANDPASDVLAHPGSAEALAFKTQEGDLVDRIDRSQARIELQAVDNLDGVVEPDVLGTQVAVPVNNSAFTNAP